MGLTLAMFPGQGSQTVGMGKFLIENFKAAQLVFEEAEDSLGVGLRKLCLEGPESELNLTANTQPAILAHSVAAWKVVTGESGLMPDFFAGHSLGEYSALVAAEKLRLKDAVRIVRRRGELMQEAVPAGKGAMSAVLNYDETQLAEDCKAVSQDLSGRGLDKLQSTVEIANYNSEKQLIVSGGAEAVSTLTEILVEKNVRVVSLPVSAPFHSSLMKPAKIGLEPLLRDASFTANEKLVIPNITGKIDKNYSVDNLVEQVDGPVLWSQTLNTAVDSGCSKFVEIGPGKVLFGLARRAVPRGSQLIATDDIGNALKLLES